MAGAEGKSVQDVAVDAGNLYREELFTDLRVASLRRLLPVKADGTDDPARPPLFIGQAHVMSAAGPIPIQFPIEAATLDEALAKFPAGVKAAVEKMIAEVKELQREEASRIIVPGDEPGRMLKLR
ncbi:MAG: hypothetical protein IT574_07805 [Candidatus Aureabacteria bacterium]|jgi:hypothetical protein|nr:hypothetical protein [Candidatus Auribacterota bacterium]NLW95251.1 hypothetical protein [Chlamydiota bacterium]HOE27267.1 hypothetical protein [bacterium]HQM51671.1 hypothetical protein [bacterium]